MNQRGWLVVYRSLFVVFLGTAAVNMLHVGAVKGLEKMPLLQRGSRLSVQPVSAAEWAVICKRTGV